RLSTFSGSIHALAISNDGQALACGAGTEGVKLWDIKSRKELTCSTHHESRGTVSCVVWVTTRLGMGETLCYGTGLGYVIFLRRSQVDTHFQEICARRLGSGFEITCMVWDSSSSEANTRIALQAVFSVRLHNTVPKSVAFGDNRCVYVFGLYDGNFIKLKGDDGAVMKEYSCQSVIGHATVNQRRGVFVVDNATNGFTLYRLEGDEEPVRTFITPAPSVSVPKQVAFGAEGRLIIGGSDHGLVYVFERKSGKLLESLRHSSTGLARDLNGRCIVASASPAQGRGKATINLWAYNYGTVKGTLTSENSHPSMVTCLFKILVHIGALMVIICF
ncbi:hypothetical protein CY34DRAFT_62186, partial [Suillus luteus UH-Slu-Lm8-n1]